MMNITNKDKPKLRFVISVVAVLTAFALIAGGVTLAGYNVSRRKSGTVQPNSFHFESPVMAETPLSFDVYDWNSSQFSVKNFDGLLQSNTDISYSLAVTANSGNSNGSGCTLLRNSSAYRNGADVTLTGAANSTDTYTLSFTGEVGDSFTATATSNSPYTKTISAVFTLCDSKGGAFYSITGYGSYAVMKVKTGTSALSLGVNWSSDWVPDNTNALMQSWTASPGTLTLEANTTYSIIFFRSSSSYSGTVGDTLLTAASTVSLPS